MNNALAVQEDFGGTGSTLAVVETASSAIAAQSKAMVESRYIMAMRNPRDVELFRARLLKHCKRPGFAEVATYQKPVGGKPIIGPSIRFVESALQAYGNCAVDVTAVYEDDEKRIVRISVTDFEANIPYSQEVTVEKFVERKSTAGGEVVGERRKKNGEVVYKVRATEDDFNNKLASATSKMIRNLGLRVLPSDIVEECQDQCSATRHAKNAEDPDAAKRKLIDAFAAINVMPDSLRDFLGHDVATSSPAEIDELRKVYAAVRDGEATWNDAVQVKRIERGEVEVKPADGTDKLKEKLAKNAAKDTAKAESPKP